VEARDSARGWDLFRYPGIRSDSDLHSASAGASCTRSTDLLALGGMEVYVDDRPVTVPEKLVYKSAVLNDVPNLVFVFGYTNSSWTLKLDLVCEYICRLISHMDQRDYDSAVPVNSDPAMETRPFLWASSATRPSRTASCASARATASSAAPPTAARATGARRAKRPGCRLPPRRGLCGCSRTC